MCQVLGQRSFRAIIKLNIFIMVVIVKTLLKKNKKVLKPFTTITIIFLVLNKKIFFYIFL